MQITDMCVDCLYGKEKARTDDPGYLAEVRQLLADRAAEDTSPYMVYRFEQAYRRRFGATESSAPLRRSYNDFVLRMEPTLRARIAASDDPLAAALVMARIGNYIDFGAMDHVDTDTFLSMFRTAELREDDRPVYDSFLRACAAGRRFLLVCDNCGEIVLDRLFLEQLQLRFPHLQLQAMVRGGEVLNDATEEDARYAGMDRTAQILSSGTAVGGTVYAMLSDEARHALDAADVILAKGQGNYETMSGQGLHAFYAFLCKCDLFTGRFGVPKLTGMLLEE